jgi:hypothetical protein
VLTVRTRGGDEVVGGDGGRARTYGRGAIGFTPGALARRTW